MYEYDTVPYFINFQNRVQHTADFSQFYPSTASAFSLIFGSIREGVPSRFVFQILVWMFHTVDLNIFKDALVSTVKKFRRKTRKIQPLVKKKK